MLVTMYRTLPINVELVFNIIEASSEYEDCGSYGRERFVFKMKVWKKSDLSHYRVVEEVMYNGGRSSNYLVDFVQNATNEEFIWYWTDVEFAIGAVFIGMITPVSRVNYNNHKKVFYNVRALRHLGYIEEEGENNND